MSRSKKSDACLLVSHGVMTVSTTIQDAYLKAEYVEEIAEIYYRTLSVNQDKEPIVLPEDELQKWQYPSYIKL
ncbi:class II aldolase/adducin family protein [Pectinatus brassicae]|uniref:Ribulose-5-phosphate 4-epimerase/fuculose-1-phosphate aldolase n=1 Tax=Pectinatus brassicae TaxID=862415 RepID=A0A840UD90_9FIRM|nr:class II aldolase/adducin family protein [Pectinatus brassicae]MBB5335056.1 ribulose-5-phosphate 4-epimerase/fuculose-1-phosphate aldolase [Pectinatus brassicae]